MKKLVLSLTVAGLFLLALGAVAGATTLRTQSTPAVRVVTPAAATNDIDTPVTITGSGFAASPTASLGGTPLANVTFVDSSTLTATVPWGMDPGTYALKVVNPDGGSASLPGAFTVTQGIGQWNGGALYGGEVHQILMKPGDPATLYAPADGLAGLFRSRDAAEHWTYVGADVFINQGKFAIDPLHPDWLYGYSYSGLHRSQDEGTTWSTVMGSTWPDGRPISHGQVYLSPYDPHVLFFSAYQDPVGGALPGDAMGLLRSTDAGASWQIVSSLDGLGVEDVAFSPSDSSQMVLVTQDARVFQSSDGGGTWAETAKPPITSVGYQGVIAYNPNHAGEVWIDSMVPDAVFKSTDAALSDWKDVTAPFSLRTGIAFAAPDSVYLSRYSSSDDGAHWTPFGPIAGNGALLFDPNDSQVAYLGDNTYGVQKTTDGGHTWVAKDQGLTGMTCRSLDVSRSDPLKLFATFGNWPGVYRSSDGAGTWSYVPAPNSGYADMTVTRADPTDPHSVYAVSHTEVYRSTDDGDMWTDLGWHAPSLAANVAVLWVMAVDPSQAGRLLVALDTGAGLTGPGYLYSSSDHGATWQAVAMPQALARITDIAFDPGTPGLVYLATGGAGNMTPGTGLYKSTDHGAIWTRIDDRAQPGMARANTIAIATHPQHVLFVTAWGEGYRSLDRGATWQKTQGAPGACYLFAGGDSTRLYAGGLTGLSSSSDAGDTWTQAAGALGGLQILALGSAEQDGCTIVYAATTGGAAGATTAGAQAPRAARSATSTLVSAGIYRYVMLPAPTLSLKLSGLKRGALRLGKRVTAMGTVTPSRFARSKVKLTVQRKRGRKWIRVKSVTRTGSRRGVYTWKYKPAKRGSYHVQATVAATAKGAAAATTWRTFKVK